MKEMSIEERIVRQLTGDLPREYLFAAVQLVRDNYDVEQLVKAAEDKGVLNKLCYLAELAYDTVRDYGMKVPIAALRQIFDRSPVQTDLQPLIPGFPDFFFGENPRAKKWNLLTNTSEEELYELLTVYPL